LGVPVAETVLHPTESRFRNLIPLPFLVLTISELCSPLKLHSTHKTIVLHIDKQFNGAFYCHYETFLLFTKNSNH